jgi:hypothetical protein
VCVVSQTGIERAVKDRWGCPQKRHFARTSAINRSGSSLGNVGPTVPTSGLPEGLDPQLVDAANKELELDGNMEHIAAFAPDDYQKYQEERRILSDFVDSAESNNPNEAVPAPDEWHKELQLIGGARKDLCNNARVALESKVSEAAHHLESERQSLERVIAALEDFKEAHEATEAAEQLSSTLMKVNQLVEVIHEPEKMYKVLEEKITGSPDDIIEAGIKGLGQVLRASDPGQSRILKLRGHGQLRQGVRAQRRHGRGRPQGNGRPLQDRPERLRHPGLPLTGSL